MKLTNQASNNTYDMSVQIVNSMNTILLIDYQTILQF